MKRLQYWISALVLFMLLGMNLSRIAAQEIPQTPLNDWSDEQIARSASLSPDGQSIAAIVGDDLCLFETATGESQCFTPPEELRIRSLGATQNFNAFSWSWDSQKIAFTENFYVFLHETDLWVFDRSDGSFTNHTDDGFYGRAMSIEDDFEISPLDYLPAFAPDGSIYFFRSDRTSDETLLQLMHFDFETETVRLVKNLSEPLLPVFSIFYQPRVSPDGTQIAFPVFGAKIDDERNGLWTLDFESGELTQWVNANDLQAILLPVPQHGPIFAIQPVWLPDSESLVFHAVMDGRSHVSNYAYLDLTTGEISLIKDLSAFDNEVEIIPEMPWVGGIHPNGEAFIYLQVSPAERKSVIVQVSLPPVAGEDPLILGEFEIENSPFVVNPIIGENGAAVFMNYLYQLLP